MAFVRTKYYFISDFHLGIPSKEESLKRELLLIKWLNTVEVDAKEIFILGDIFDFWFEYSTVVPKGFVRFLAKISELSSSGIPIHFFRGNHDLWASSYLESETGMLYHRKPETIVCNGKKIHLAHGDGLGKGDKSYKFLLKIFESRFNQLLFRWIHPDIGIRFANLVSNKYRYTKNNNKTLFDKYNECLYDYAINKIEKESDIDFFIFGHRHIPVHTKIDNSKADFIILGDWMYYFTYGMLDETGCFTLLEYQQ